MALNERGARTGRFHAVVALIAACAGLWLRSAALDTGLASDDFAEAAMLDGSYPAPRSSLDLFNFTDGTPEDARPLIDYGALPWWTADGLRLAMMRPLASALVLFDVHALGGDPFLRHLHSAFWWLATLGVVAILLRRLVRAGVAALALVIFALEEGHTLPLAWLANRGALVAMTLGLAGLWAHLRYREDGWLPGRWWTWCLLSLALTCGEWAIPILGYVAAYELVAGAGSLRARLRALLPAVIPGLVFLAARAILGYGTRHSGVYIDPFTEPLEFLTACMHRVPVLAADLAFGVPAVWWDSGSPWREQIAALGLIPADVWVRLPGWRTYHLALGVLALVASTIVVRWGLSRVPASEGRALRWLWVGALLSLLPMVLSFPTSRLVLPASVATSALAAAVVVQGADYVRRGGRGLVGRTVVAVAVAAVLWIQLVQAARTSHDDTTLTRLYHRSTLRVIDEADLDVPGLEDKRVILLSSHEHSIAVFTPFVRRYLGNPMPRSFWTLSGAPQAIDLHRPRPNVLELSILVGTLLETDVERLYRSDHDPLQLGDVIRLDGLTVEIARLVQGRPQRVRFVFDHSLDDPRYVVLASTLFGLRRVPVPEVGQTLRYPRPVMPDSRQLDFVVDHVDVNSSCLVRPAIDDCRYGHAFADCGGHGEPVFACHGFGDCRWFVGGCVAVGYVSSSCSADAVCCRSGWPFDDEDEAFRSGALSPVVGSVLAGWGTTPMGADRSMNLSVEEEPGRVWDGVGLACHGSFGDRGPCVRSVVTRLPAHHASFAIAFEAADRPRRWGLTLEVVRSRHGVVRGRVCKVVHGHVEPGECPGPRAPECALAGEVVLDVLPEEPRELGTATGRFFADFGGGRFVYGSF